MGELTLTNKTLADRNMIKWSPIDSFLLESWPYINLLDDKRSWLEKESELLRTDRFDSSFLVYFISLVFCLSLLLADTFFPVLLFIPSLGLPFMSSLHRCFMTWHFVNRANSGFIHRWVCKSLYFNWGWVPSSTKHLEFDSKLGCSPFLNNYSE